MISESFVKRFTPICDTCGWKGTTEPRQTMAEFDLRGHKCDEHREEHDSTGGYRGILGGYNRRCVCGAGYVSEGFEKFACPKADKTLNVP